MRLVTPQEYGADDGGENPGASLEESHAQQIPNLKRIVCLENRVPSRRGDYC